MAQKETEQNHTFSPLRIKKWESQISTQFGSPSMEPMNTQQEIVLTATTNQVSESEKWPDKPSNTCNVTFWVIRNQPMPFLTISPCSAQGENIKINANNIPFFQHIEAQYAHSGQRSFDSWYSISSKGRMNTQLYENWISEQIIPCFPVLAAWMEKLMRKKPRIEPC
jgi:hypothetical protein